MEHPDTIAPPNFVCPGVWIILNRLLAAAGGCRPIRLAPALRERADAKGAVAELHLCIKKNV